MKAVIPSDMPKERVVLSSEKFFGPKRTALIHGQFYPFAGQRAAYTSQLLPDCQIEIFVGLSNPGSFVPKVLMSLHESQRDAILGSTDLSCLSWLNMIEDLRDLAPEIQLTFWQNEDTPLIWGDIMRAMAGVPSSVLLKDEHALLASLLTEKGKTLLLDHNRQSNKKDPEERKKKSGLDF